MSTADDLVRAHQPPPYTATVRALMSAHRLTERMLVVLLAVSRKEVEADGTWQGRDRRHTVRALIGLESRVLIRRDGRCELTYEGRQLVDQLGGAR